MSLLTAFSHQSTMIEQPRACDQISISGKLGSGIQCYFLTRLPAELRIRIYELLLTFNGAPIKLRQHVSGSPDTAIIRTNRQISNEAMAVLYDLNVIVVTRNDFCLLTISALKTPVFAQHIRHLLITSFGESITCTFLSDQGKCNVCKDSAVGLLAALSSMPYLKKAYIDYSGSAQRFKRFREHWGEVQARNPPCPIAEVGANLDTTYEKRCPEVVFFCTRSGQTRYKLTELSQLNPPDSVEARFSQGGWILIRGTRPVMERDFKRADDVQGRTNRVDR
ncbi:hypothetical protein BAUCODRAFT_507344 [Baudoinia panamericana UAMH 10762]|uniref:F-box domain-containing protein n=1 Tax=Baudoinia panamericana (strain UAMH 10762) TaxID=717646 RepID=M2MGW6_BAUPA|nr:uncharacterized protein BAUCODRAFT_507344 [Baudoinia panamericana UAMH 10762]EMC95876.1 hypothetical protein BAUCODRAFT_507344 [Baudoinia panamericana UAMH 10762]